MKTILLIDDEEENLFIMKETINFLTNDFQILQATNILDAIKILESQQIDLIISDYNLKVSNVSSLTDWLNENQFQIPLSIMSGFLPDLSDLNYAHQVESLNKPFDDEEILSVIKLVS